jgi:hypothetical protein
MENPQWLAFRKQAVEKARAAGLPAYFLDETGPGVIRVLPDGRKDRIVVMQGKPPQIQPVECRC